MKSLPGAGTIRFPPTEASVKNNQIDILPLLDMAGQVELPELQAESASLLADLAQDGMHVERLCTSAAFKRFKQLLMSDRTEVAYPTACMLQSLVQYPEAAACFADCDIMSTIVEKARSAGTC